MSQAEASPKNRDGTINISRNGGEGWVAGPTARNFLSRFVLYLRGEGGEGGMRDRRVSEYRYG